MRFLEQFQSARALAIIEHGLAIENVSPRQKTLVLCVTLRHSKEYFSNLNDVAQNSNLFADISLDAKRISVLHKRYRDIECGRQIVNSLQSNFAPHVQRVIEDLQCILDLSLPPQNYTHFEQNA